MKPLTERIAERERRLQEEAKVLKQLKARLARQTAKEKKVEAEKQRRADTRRKILVGSWMLQMIESGEFPQEKFVAGMRAYLTREDDRALFNLGATDEDEFFS